MKDITRVHLAKIAYDIELSAKKDLENYIRKIQVYTSDEELLQDIEIRITEILNDRGVVGGGVIAEADIEAVCAQLGEPKDFFDGDEESVVVAEAKEEDRQARRLYRDIDSAVLGGVASGVAKFFGINPLWVRLLLVAGVVMSFGVLIPIYIFFWIITPAARTTAEKLQMQGKEVTLSSLREFNETMDVKGHNRAQIVRSILRYGTAMMFALFSVVAFIFTLWVAVGILFGVSDSSLIAGYIPDDSVLLWVAYGLFVMSGLLLAFLAAILAYALAYKKWSKKLGVGIAATIIGGIITFSTGVAFTLYEAWGYDIRYNQTEMVRTTLPQQYSSVEQLTVTVTEDATYSLPIIRYVVAQNWYVESTGVEYEMLFSDNHKEATLTVSPTARPQHIFSRGSNDVLTIYGPELQALYFISGSGGVTYAHSGTQSEMKLVASGPSAYIRLEGSYGHIEALTENQATIALDDATVETLVATTVNGRISAGVVRDLMVTQPDICPADGYSNHISVVAVNGQLVYNGQKRASESIESNCATLKVGDDNQSARGWRRF